MGKAKIVTAYVPLDVRHVSRDAYRRYFDVILAAVGEENVHAFHDFPYEECWLVKDLGDKIPLAVEKPVPEDRYADVLANVKSNVVQHNRTEWAHAARLVYPDVDTWIWLDYGIAKQGEGHPHPVTKDNIRRFFARVSERDLSGEVPFPGINPPREVPDTGHCFRFCGSTHVWPRNWLTSIDAAYKSELLRWIARNKTTPLDLPIWALVERNHPHIPYRFYQAEYGSFQLDNFPGSPA